MNLDYNAAYASVTIVNDETGGLVSLDSIKRHNEDRKTKLRNNFTGQLVAADSNTLFQLVTLLNKKLPPSTDREVVVGMMVSGVIMCGYLSFVRKSSFNYSIHDRYGEDSEVFEFSKKHRNDKCHYLYGIKPGDEALLIEDEITSGNGVVGLTQALREYGVKVTAIATVIETVNFHAREKIKQTTDLDLVSLLQIKVG